LGLYIEKDEAVQIGISVIALSLAFAIAFAGLDGMIGSPREFVVFIAPILVTLGSGFILHEMAHKLVAMYYGAQARFVMWTQGLVVMFISSLAGVLIAAPGAVYIYSNRISTRENGIISIAGAVLNLSVAFFFIALEFIMPIKQFYGFLLPLGAGAQGYGILYGILSVWRFGAATNIMLALFNMIPIFPLDGSKVFWWSKPVWGLFVLVLLAAGSVVISPGIVIGWLFMFALAFALSMAVRLLVRPG